MEFLKEFLSEDTFAKVQAELKGKEDKVKLFNLKNDEYVSKDKYKALETANKELQAELTGKKSAYDELVKKAGDNQALKDEIETLKTNAATKEAEIQKNYESKLRDVALKSELVKAKAKDVNDILGLLDMETITYKNDAFTGLTEQINKLKENKAYLFNTEETPKNNKGGLDHTGGAADVDNINDMRAIMGLPPKKE